MHLSLLLLALSSLANVQSSCAAPTDVSAIEKRGQTSGPLTMNGIQFGFLPDDGDAGGKRQTMASLNTMINGPKAATYGWYAQAHSGQTFTGDQLLAVIDDVAASGAIFEPAVMPVGGWKGLSSDDNSQAVNIAKVMKKFTDRGIQVRLRFAHEINYYLQDGTYSGGTGDNMVKVFKEAWKTVAAAVRQYAPGVKMFYSPNRADLATYERYFPDDPNDVDFIGVDYYPNEGELNSYVSALKPFHDKYTSNGRIKMAQGETGLHYKGSAEDRISWVKEITSADTHRQLPNLVSVSWFNYVKNSEGNDFRVVVPGDYGGVTDMFKKAFGLI